MKVAFKMRDSVPSVRYSSVCNVLHCVNGESGSSLLIESTYSMIINVFVFLTHL